MPAEKIESLKKKREEAKRKGREASRRQSEAIQIRKATELYQQVLDGIVQTLSTVEISVKRAIDVHSLLSSGGISSRRVSTRLEIMKTARMAAFIASDLARKVNRVRQAGIDFPEDSGGMAGDMLEKLTQAIELLHAANEGAPSVLSSFRKPPPELRDLSRSSVVAAAMLKKINRRLKSRAHVVAEAAFEAVNSPSLEFE